MITETEKTKLKKWCNTFFNQNSLDSKVFDIDSEIDSKLTYEENKSILRSKLRKLFNVYSNVEVMSKKESEIMDIKQVEVYTAEMKNKEIEDIKKIQNEYYNSIIKTDSTEKINEILGSINNWTKQLVYSMNRKGLLWENRGGIGKTFNTIKGLNECNLIKDIDYIFHIGTISPIQIAQALADHNNKINVFDDVDLSNKEVLNILKQALVGGEISYNTKHNFIKKSFKGKIIITTNHLPKNPDVEAVKSRCFCPQYNLTHSQVIILFYEFSKLKEFCSYLSKEEKIEIVDYIKSITSQLTSKLDLRVFENSCECYKYDKENWKKKVCDLIYNDISYYLISQNVSKEEYIALTGESERTYFRHKEQMGLTDKSIMLNKEHIKVRNM
jgi:hypothetical protein